jgi:hypothetical protein
MFNEVTGGWRKLQNKKFSTLSNLCSLPDVVRVIKWRRMRWAWFVTCMGGLVN